MIDFPHKIWADEDKLREYHEAVARVRETNPDVAVPSHLDPRGFDHVLGVLKDMEAKPDSEEKPDLLLIEDKSEAE